MKKTIKIIFIILGLLFMPIYTVGAEAPKTFDAESIFEQTKEAIFYLRVYTEDGTLKDVGTGFYIDKEGKGITAYHVIEGAHGISIVLHNDKVINDIKVVAADKQMDIAVLKLPAIKEGTVSDRRTAYLSLRNDGKVKHGEKIFAIGYPMKDTKVITEGIVNAPSSMINQRDRILVSAQFLSGMSGGPVIDKFGQVIGCVSGTLKSMNSISLTVPISQIKKVMEDEKYRINDGFIDTSYRD